MSVGTLIASFIKQRVIDAHEADLKVGDESRPSLERWRIINTRFLRLYVHRLLSDDPDNALHDHPWASLSWLLSGKYVEVTENTSYSVDAGTIKYRSASYRHRILVPDQAGEVITLFLAGPKVRIWRFWPVDAHGPAETTNGDKAS